MRRRGDRFRVLFVFLHYVFLTRFSCIPYLRFSDSPLLPIPVPAFPRLPILPLSGQADRCAHSDLSDWYVLAEHQWECLKNCEDMNGTRLEKRENAA